MFKDGVKVDEENLMEAFAELFSNKVDRLTENARIDPTTGLT